MVMPLTFIRPLSPSAAVRPPKGDDWLHEPELDGFRFQVIKDGKRCAALLQERRGLQQQAAKDAQGLRRMADELGNSRHYLS